MTEDAAGLTRCGWERRGGKWAKAGAVEEPPSPLTPGDAGRDLRADLARYRRSDPGHSPHCRRDEDLMGNLSGCTCGIALHVKALPAALRTLLTLAARLGCEATPGAILAAVEALRTERAAP